MPFSWHSLLPWLIVIIVPQNTGCMAGISLSQPLQERGHGSLPLTSGANGPVTPDMVKDMMNAKAGEIQIANEIRKLESLEDFVGDWESRKEELRMLKQVRVHCSSENTSERLCTARSAVAEGVVAVRDVGVVRGL